MPRHYSDEQERRTIKRKVERARRTHTKRAYLLLTLLVLLVGVAVAYNNSAHKFSNPQNPEKSYVVLKASFHTHTTVSDGNFTPTKVVEIYAKAGYDCIAITDHGNVAGVPEAKSAGKKFGVIVIAGQEISPDFPDGSPMHIVALWVNVPIPIGYDNPKPYFDIIHSYGGIGIVAHPWIIANWYSTYDWTKSPWYPYRNAKWIDGWEMSFEYKTSVFDSLSNSGYFLVLNHDFHKGAVPTDRYTILFAHNRTEDGVREALLSRRNVMHYQGNVYGTQYAIELFNKHVGGH